MLNGSSLVTPRRSFFLIYAQADDMDRWAHLLDCWSCTDRAGQMGLQRSFFFNILMSSASAYHGLLIISDADISGNACKIFLEIRARSTCICYETDASRASLDLRTWLSLRSIPQRPRSAQTYDERAPFNFLWPFHCLQTLAQAALSRGCPYFSIEITIF